jgi:periplasmic protein TonB
MFATKQNNIYGAFELKKIYPKNYSIGLGLAIVLHLLLVLMYVIVNPKERIDETVKQYKIVTYVDLGPPPSIVHDDYFNTPPQSKPTFGTLKIAKKGEETTNLETPKESSEPSSNIKVEAPKPVLKKEIPVDETYYVAVDMMPEPFGGMESLQKNVSYPEQARKESIFGKVFVKAFINENGEVTRAEIVKGLGYGCDEEALWAVKSARFRPGKKNGNRVKVQYTLSITFRPN